MSHNRLVSIIVIFFNAQPFMAETIDSILAQTYEDWELLLVDDGSTDGSTEVAQHYVQRHPTKIRYLAHPEHQNRGMSATRNLGIHHARGQFITFLDADDIWLPNTLADQVAILTQHSEAAMVYGPIRWWYGWTGNPEDQQRDWVEHYDVPRDRLVDPPTLVLGLLQKKLAISGMLIRREVVEQVGAFEDKFRGLYEDQAFCAKICLQFPVFSASQCWYQYRQHPNSCTNIAQPHQERIARRTFLTWFGQYLSQQGNADRRVWQALQNERFRASMLWHYISPMGRTIFPKSIRHSIRSFGKQISLRIQT